MQRTTFAVAGVAALIGLAVACSSSSNAPLSPTPPSNNLPADGSTLKVPAPTPQSPADGQALDEAPVLSASAVAPSYAASVPLQYRFQIFNDANVKVDDSGLLNAPNWSSSATLEGKKRHTWKVRAEYQGNVGPWSNARAFISSEGGFIRGSTVVDPPVNGKTVGQRHGGGFIPGQGWQSLSLTDGIDYDIATCSNCTAEFDVTNFGKGEGECCGKDLKWFTMGDANAFGNFSAFRDHPWKMHLEQRADGNGTGMKLIWRNGGVGDGEPGDHTGKLATAVDWRSDQVFHFTFDWSPSGMQVRVNGEVWFQDGFGGNAYAPPNHRISLGCYPRAESFIGAIFRNVRVTPH